MSRTSKVEIDYVKTQDRIFDFIQKEIQQEVNCDHEYWNDICEIRNQIVNLIEKTEGENNG